MFLMQASDSLADVSGYYQEDHGCKIMKAAASLVALCNQSINSAINVNLSSQSLQLDCNQGNHSVVKTTIDSTIYKTINLFLQCKYAQKVHIHDSNYDYENNLLCGIIILVAKNFCSINVGLSVLQLPYCPRQSAHPHASAHLPI